MSPAAGTVSREGRARSAAAADGQVWWAEVADVRERIERRRAVERVRRRREAGHRDERPRLIAGSRRTITITGHVDAVPAHVTAPGATDGRRAGAIGAEQAWAGSREPAGRAAAAGTAYTGPSGARRRPRRTAAEWLGARPDRIAAWAVALGFLLVLAALLSAH